MFLHTSIITSHKSYFMSKAKTIVSIPDQVRDALDGRTQRWLSFNVKIPESDLSKKMNNSVPFTQDEIDRINAVLKSNIKL